MASDDNVENNKKKNVVRLPDSAKFLRCSLCEGNIEASIMDLKMDPAVLRTTADDSDEKFWFCGTCYTNRLSDIQKLVNRHFAYSSPSAASGAEAVKMMIGDDPIYRVYRSTKSNRFGEHLKVVFWKSKLYGMFGLISLVKGDAERPFCFNLKGFRLSEYKLSLAYIKSHYKSEYGDLIEDSSFRSVSASFKTARLPLFRSRLVGLDLDFLIFKEDENVIIKIGFTEISLNKIDYDDISVMMLASVAYLKFGDISLLKAFQDMRESEGPNLELKTVWLPSKNKKEIVATSLPSRLSFSVGGSPEMVKLSVGNASITLPVFDFIDITTTLKSFKDVLLASTAAEEAKAVERVRRDRYLWLSSFVSINFRFIMRDFGWYFDSGSLADAS